MNRDEYVEKLKAQIDLWNADMAKLEARARQGQATLKTEYTAQLEQFRKRRDDAISEMRRLQSASMDAWKELARGADDALKNMQEAFDKARASFDKKK